MLPKNGTRASKADGAQQPLSCSHRCHLSTNEALAQVLARKLTTSGWLHSATGMKFLAGAIHCLAHHGFDLVARALFIQARNCFHETFRLIV